VSILHRIRRAFARSDPPSEQGIAGGTVGTEIGLGKIEAAERREFPPEEFASADDDEESES
jgi:hypothetical protein